MQISQKKVQIITIMNTQMQQIIIKTVKNY
jgi:hypothetical protein